MEIKSNKKIDELIKLSRENEKLRIGVQLSIMCKEGKLSFKDYNAVLKYLKLPVCEK